MILFLNEMGAFSASLGFKSLPAVGACCQPASRRLIPKPLPFKCSPWYDIWAGLARQQLCVCMNAIKESVCLIEDSMIKLEFLPLLWVRLLLFLKLYIFQERTKLNRDVYGEFSKICMHTYTLPPTICCASPGHSGVLFGPPPLFLHMCIKHAAVLERSHEVPESYFRIESIRINKTHFCQSTLLFTILLFINHLYPGDDDKRATVYILSRMDLKVGPLWCHR